MLLLLNTFDPPLLVLPQVKLEFLPYAVAVSVSRSPLLSLCNIRMAHFFIVLNNSYKIRYCLI